MKKQCPLCGKSVKVIDVGEHTSAWFARHWTPGTRNQCPGSNMTAIDREEQLPEEQPAPLKLG